MGKNDFSFLNMSEKPCGCGKSDVRSHMEPYAWAAGEEELTRQGLEV
jgi:hypothetical protein